MKKTLSITLGGRSFLIEEDGYQALDAYLQRLRTHFANDPSVDELVRDIEYSFGEKFSEKLTKEPQVVTLQDVEAVIAVVGRVEEIADESSHEIPSSQTHSTTATESIPTKKRLYRNPDDQIIAGVCSGLAAYFGVDPLVFRLLALVLLFINGLGLLVYLVLYISLPVATTSLQKLEMQGKSPSLNEFQELAKDKPLTAVQESWFYKLLNWPLRVIGFLFDALKRFFSLFGSVIRVLAGVGLLAFSFLFVTLGTMALVVFSTNVNSRYITSDLPLAELAKQPLYYIGLASVYLLALIPLIFLAILGVSLLRRKNQFRLGVTATLIGLWIIAAGGAAAAATNLGPWMYTQIQTLEQRTTVTRALSVEPFEQIQLADNLHIRVRQGDVTNVTFSGPEEELARIQATTTNGVLVLTQSNQKERDSFRLCFACFSQGATGVITIPRLTRYVGQDNSSAHIEGFANNLELQTIQNAHLTISGLGRAGTSTEQAITLLQTDNSFIELNGNIKLLDANLKDNTRLNADELDALEVRITTEDNASATISPTQSLAATSTRNSFIRSTNAVTSSTISERQNSRVFIPNSREDSRQTNE